MLEKFSRYGFLLHRGNKTRRRSLHYASLFTIHFPGKNKNLRLIPVFSHYHSHRVYLRYRFLMCFSIKGEKKKRKRRMGRMMAAKRGEIWKTGHCRRPWLCSLARLSKKRWYQPGWTNRIRYPLSFCRGCLSNDAALYGRTREIRESFFNGNSMLKRYYGVN